MLWEPADGGWRIHDWAKYQLDTPTREALAKARSEAGRLGGLARQAKARVNGHGSAQLARENQANQANVKQMPSKPQAKSAPVPVPFASKEAKKIRARETVRAESVSSEQPAPPLLSAQRKPKHQPKTDGAWRCPHIPLCPSYGACIKRTLDEANDRS